MKKKLMRFNLAALALVMVTSVLISGTFAKYTTAVSAQDTALIAKWDISSAGLGEMKDENGDPKTNVMDLFNHAYDEAILQNVGEDYILGPGVEDEFVVNLKGQSDVDALISLTIEKLDGSVIAPIQFAVETEQEKIDRGATDFDWSSAKIYYSEHLLAEAILNAMVEAGEGAKVIANNLDVDDQRKVEAVVNAEAATPEEKHKAGERTIILKKSDVDVEKNITVHWRWPFDETDHKTSTEYINEMKAVGITGSGDGGIWTNADDTELGVASAEAGTRTTYGLSLTLKADQVTPSKEPLPTV